MERCVASVAVGSLAAYSHYTAQTGKRIQAVLNGAPPASCARSTAPLIAEGLSGKY
jgi:hypothetical protein